MLILGNKESSEMKKSFLLIFILFFTLGCRFSIPFMSSNSDNSGETASPSAEPDFENPAQPESSSTVSDFDQANLGATIKDITYCTMDNVALKMDVYYPPVFAPEWPVAMYVHGGGWRSGDKTQGIGMRDVEELTKNGFLVFSVNYRLAPEFKFPAMIEDVKCAVRYLRAHADEYNLDPGRFGVWGSSAGGHLVSLMGTSDTSAGWDIGEYLDQSSQVQAVVDMFGPTDFTQKFEGGNAEIQNSVFGMQEYIQSLAKAASPVNYVSSDDPPFLIIHGAEDALVPLSQSQLFFDQLQASGVSSELVVVQNAGHGFAPVDGKIISPNRREITQKMVNFFIETLKY